MGRTIKTLLRGALLALVIMVAVPAVLVPLYWVGKPISVPMMYRYVTQQPVDRRWRDIDDISDRLKASVMMSEDGQFCRHWGVDVGALRDEVKNYMAGRKARGASTISMQLARNLFLWNSRSVVRKVLEVPLAGYLDLVLSKRRIMEIYLNVAEWGPGGQFGIEAGVQGAFGVNADALSWERAALMAVALPNPHEFFPGRPGRRTLRVSRVVMARAQEFGPNRIGCLYRDGRVRLE